MMLKLYIDVLMPPQHLFLEDCGFIFRKEASQSQIAVSTFYFRLFAVTIVMYVVVNNGNQ